MILPARLASGVVLLAINSLCNNSNSKDKSLKPSKRGKNNEKTATEDNHAFWERGSAPRLFLFSSGTI